MTATLVDMGSQDRPTDLLQVAFAKLYLSWDRIRDRGALDGYVRRVMVNENNSLWRRAWKRREHSTDTMPGMGGVPWSFVQTLPPKQRAVVVLRYYEQLSEAEIAEELGISPGTVKSQASRALAALRARAPAPSAPTRSETHDEPDSPRGPGPRRPAPPGRPDPARALHRHRRTSPRPPHPAPPRRRGRCRRRRGHRHRGSGRADRDRIEPEQRGAARDAAAEPGPAARERHRAGDPRSAEVVEETPVPLMDVDGPSLTTPDGTIDLPKVYDTLIPYLDGWVGIAMDEGQGTIQFLDADLAVEDGGSPTGGLVASPDGQRVAWSEYTGSQWQVIVAHPTGGAEWVYTTFPPAPQTHIVVPVGFITADEVAVRAYDDTTTTTTYAAGGQPVEIPGLLQVDAASPATGVVSGLTEYMLEGACSAVVDGLARTGAILWKTCDHRFVAFSPGGTYVVGIDPMAHMDGSPTITVLDAASGREVVTFEAVLPRRTVGGFWTQMAWEGDEALVVRMSTEDDYVMMRLGLDGSVQRIDIPGAGVSGLSVAVPS